MTLASSKRWVAVILLISIGLRFIGLNQINGPVFDEVFYPQYGLLYLQGEDFFYAHPPLANYLYAFAIWAYSLLPWVNIESYQTIGLSSIEPISYRWINALLGSLLCLIIYGICFLLTKNRMFAILTSILVAIEGSLIVDSRIALANTFLLTFGFTGLYFLLRFYANQGGWYNLIVSGVFMAMAVSVKWSGLGFLLGAVCFALLTINKQETGYKKLTLSNSIYYGLIILITYVAIFLPDTYLNPSYGFFEKHQQILSYHQTMVTGNEHPYCSKWYTWPTMFRPIGYFFESTPINNVNMTSYFKALHLFPNPFIYWFSSLSIILMMIQFAINPLINSIQNQKELMLKGFICFGYLANFLPWAFVERCLFLYHYQTASIFSFLALAWYLSQLLNSKKLQYRSIFVLTAIVILVSFLYWLPLQMGFLMPDYEFYRRMWFNSWI